uniref:C2H2-type domain-containing protein n=1 Tax=Timema monikensis TaxID=170555 RepID=A0A7R9E2Q0_9NEOP|nr:unnamed protein product [Timema monikensis]
MSSPLNDYRYEGISATSSRGFVKCVVWLRNRQKGDAPVIQSTTSLASKTTPITQVTSSSRSNIQTRTRGQITPTQTPPGQKTPVAAPKQNLVPLTPAGRGRGKPSITMPRPTESNSVGGLSAGSNKPKSAPPGSAPIVDLTDDDARPTGSGNVVADSREVTFNKLSGKTFPSLVVVARPNLRVKLIPQSTVTQERTELDTKVKSVLMFTPTKFTEWLIQKGLVRSEQYCATHLTADSPPVRLKLGMYSDVSKFPYSGGYVWISECCPQRFVSVFHGSIFEGAPHPPTVLLKLMYHWSCQTNVQNVVQWVKVDNFYVKNFFSNMRSVCTAAVHEKYEKMGGPRKKIEVGVISLGTTSQDGNMRQVKVEVLGVMDHENNLIRLRAVEPLQDGERNYKRRFVKILEPLDQWVDKESSILTDFTVDKGTLHSMGFNQVYQVSVNEAPSTNNKFSNHNVMEYLRRIVPRMFQNTLSLLSRQIIQQFLDELVWRERWGPVPSQAFDNIIQHMAEQTKLDTGDSLLTRLAKVAANPFKLWTYASWKPPTPAVVTNGTTAKPPGSTQVGAKSMPAPLPPLRPVPASRPGPSSRPGPASRSAPASRPTPAENAVVSSIDMLPQSIRETPGPKRSRKRGAAGEASTPPETKRVATPPQPKSVATLPQPKRGVTPPQSDEQTALDVYYYGSLDGDPNVIKGEYKTNLDVKCCVCHRKFTNNIQLMKHLIMHVQSNSEFTTELSDLTQCKYCFKSFPTPYAMQNHMEDLHMKTNASLVCRICEDKFRDRLSLITHMHKNHVAMELPYECGICKFRSSMHKDIIDHFYEVHSGGEKLQCPFCLKVVAVSNNGKKISANINFFLNHMQKHQRKSLARKCNKCALWFVHKGILKEHQIKDHSSFKGMPGTKQYLNQNGIEVMMPVPTAYPSSQRGGPLQKKGSPQLRTAYNMKKFEQLNIQGVETGAVCCECEGDMLGEEHFPGYLQCMRCRYSTCCSKAMNEHTVVFHDTARPPEFSLGRVVQLSKEMHCVCGFKSAKGNRLATHLTRCERKSAYPSPAHAKAATVQSASFPPLVTLDDADNAEDDPSDRWLKAFVPSRKDEGEGTKDQPDKKVSAQSGGGDPPSMLNILGLVRKPSTDESSLDKAPSDNEGATDSKMEAGK